MCRWICALRVARIRFASAWQRHSRHRRRGVVDKKRIERDEDESEHEDGDETAAAAAVALGVIQTQIHVNCASRSSSLNAIRGREASSAESHMKLLSPSAGEAGRTRHGNSGLRRMKACCIDSRSCRRKSRLGTCCRFR